MTRDYTTMIQQTGGPGGVIVDQKPKMPKADELTGGARREFLPGSVVGVEYTWKRFSNEWDAIEQNRIWDPDRPARASTTSTDSSGGGPSRCRRRPTTPASTRGSSSPREGRPTDRLDYHVSHTLSVEHLPLGR